MALLNLAKIAEALEVDISQLFTYTSVESNEESQADLQEIMNMLEQQNPQQIAMAKNVLKAIFNHK